MTNKIAIFTSQTELTPTAKTLAHQLNLPIIQTMNDTLPFILLLDDKGLSLIQTEKHAPGPIRVDFVEGKLAHRRRNQQKELLVKAAGITSVYKPTILDATAGFGSDAFVLATKGCQVIMLERSPIVAALLQDGLNRALENHSLRDIISNMRLINIDSISYLKTLIENPDVIYLDPMFPLRKKSACVKKEMSALQKLLDPRDNIEELFQLAIQQAKKHVIVKRPKLAPSLTDRKPNFQLKGKSCRFDVYAS